MPRWLGKGERLAVASLSLASCSVFPGMSDPALMGNDRRANHTATAKASVNIFLSFVPPHFLAFSPFLAL
jgi:hypothetical protein